MDLSFTQEQELLRRTARELFQRECPKSLVREMEDDPQGYSRDLWQRAAELGWLGLPFPPELGGAGGTFLDLAVLLEEVGRAIAPIPIFSTLVLGGLPIARFGVDEQRRTILPAIASDHAILTFALLEHRSSYRPEGVRMSAKQSGGGYLLNGAKIFVENAHIADAILCAARTDPRSHGDSGITVFVVDRGTPGVSIEPLKPMSQEKQFEVTFKDAYVPEGKVLGAPGAGWEIVEQTLQWAIAGQCAMAVGGAEAVLELAVEYAKKRVQFSRPIGSFQAVQHHAANMYSDAETMRLMAYELAWLVSGGRPCAEEMAMAKAWVSTAYTRITRTAIQVHGGIGLAKETDPQLYFRRAKAWEPLFGGPDQHRAALGAAL